jgi:hypothetical protein
MKAACVGLTTDDFPRFGHHLCGRIRVGPIGRDEASLMIGYSVACGRMFSGKLNRLVDCSSLVKQRFRFLPDTQISASSKLHQ